MHQWIFLPRMSLTIRNRKTGRFPSGQRGQTVNLLAMPSQVRILLSPGDWKEAHGRGMQGKACGRSLKVKPWPSKPVMRVRFPSAAFQCTTELMERRVRNAGVAQSVEHLLGKDEVMGSSPIASLDIKLASMERKVTVVK